MSTYSDIIKRTQTAIKTGILLPYDAFQMSEIILRLYPNEELDLQIILDDITDRYNKPEPKKEKI